MNSRQFLYLIVATCITALVWVILDILHSRAQVQPPPEIQKMIEPISPTFDQEIINEL